ncbi:MAG: ATP-binding cassette domain-containing protein [Candidatus Eisenbacteria bacterium]|nr:ATP-binding cassette domain-containing protein [Candidatus Eisenbacteria bacterium]
MEEAQGQLPEESGNSEPTLVVESLWKSYASGPGRLEVLRGIDLHVAPGQVVAILGASGSGKSTLLQLLGALDRPDRGSIRYAGREVSRSEETERAVLRNRFVGFIFQYHHLLAEFSALENVALPRLVAGERPREAWQRARALLELVGLSERSAHRPGQLSGGEQQRVALARALVNEPALVLADEPTGNLDRSTGEALYELLYSLARQGRQSWVVATHNEYLAQMADLRWQLVDGMLHRADSMGK